MNISQTIRFCNTATFETLKRNSYSAPYLSDFFEIARVRSLRDARIWLLGQLVMNHHPDSGTPESVPHAHPQSPSPYSQPSDGPRARLQQHIETAALQLDKTPPTF